MATKPDDRITKRRVTMTTYVFAGVDHDGEPTFMKHEAVDYIRPDFLDAYLADARGSGKWQSVEVSDEPDAGPAGYDGATYVPDHLDHPLAGQLFPATEQKG